MMHLTSLRHSTGHSGGHPRGHRVDMDSNTAIQKLRAASCSVLLLLLTLALVASSLLVARYAVQASSWWLSLLAVTVCLLGLCTWIQLAASRAGRWRAMLARRVAESRGLAEGLTPLQTVDLCIRHPRHGAVGIGRTSVSVIPVDFDLETQIPYRVPGPPPPPPYALPDLPPSYGVSSAASSAPSAASVNSTPSPSPAREPPPPYSVAITRDPLVQKAESEGSEAPGGASGVNNNNITTNQSNRNGVAATDSSNRRTEQASRRPFLWY